MQAHSGWLNAIKKRVMTEKNRVITEKKRGIKNMKIRNCFYKYAIEDNQVA